MEPASSESADVALQREIDLMRRRSRQLSRRNAITWCGLLVLPGVAGAFTLAWTVSESRALLAAIATNWLVRQGLKKLRWKEP